MNTTLKSYYRSRYPHDEAINDIAPRKTFNTLLKTLKNGEDVYEVIGVADSFIRETLFQGLAETLGVDYDTIYRLWLYS